MLSGFYRNWHGLAAALVGLSAIGALAWPFAVDDAFIVARYAENIVATSTYSINPDGVESDGVTGPLWLLPHLAALALGVPAVPAVKALGLACTLAAVALWWRRLCGRALGTAAGALSIPLWLSAADLAVWPVAGLETGAALLAASVAALAVTARKPAGALAGVAIAALAWLRPELAAFAAALCAGLYLRQRRAGLVALAIAGLGAGVLVALRLSWFGDPLPLSYYAKPPELRHGAGYVLRWLVLGASGVGLPLAFYGAARGRGSDRLLLGALLAHLAGVALAGGDWMPGFRLMVPVLPVYVVLATLGVLRLWRRRRRLGPAMLGLACLLPAADLATRIGELRAAGAARAQAGAELSRWLATHAGRVALVDVGYLGLASGVEVIDLAGITDRDIAHMPGGHLDKRIPAAWLRARAPDTLVLHSAVPPRARAGGGVAIAGYPVERRVARMAWVRRELRTVKVVRYAPAYYYAVLQRSPPSPSLLESAVR